MYYGKMKQGIFLQRPNRFIAEVEIDGIEQTVHVKNTGRCRELLIPGAEIYLEKSEKSTRKTEWDLIAVVKDGRLINMDSQAPNKAVEEWLRSGRGLGSLRYLKPERRYGDSRFDFYGEKEDGSPFFMEVKGVTLERENAAFFPDAPTERGVKHIHELVHAFEEGYEAYILFVIQMKGIRYFSPNDEMHAAFGKALREAAAAGVKILAYECDVTPNTMVITDPIEIRL